MVLRRGWGSRSGGGGFKKVDRQLKKTVREFVFVGERGGELGEGRGKVGRGVVVVA